MATNSPPFALAQIPAKVNHAYGIVLPANCRRIQDDVNSPKSGSEDYMLPVGSQDNVRESNLTENEMETSSPSFGPAQIPAKVSHAYDDVSLRKSGVPEEYTLPVALKSKVSDSRGSENEMGTSSSPFESTVKATHAYEIVLPNNKSGRIQDDVVSRNPSPEEYILPVSHNKASESKLSRNDMGTSRLAFQTTELETNVNAAYAIDQTQSKTKEALHPRLSQRPVHSTAHRLQNSKNKRKKIPKTKFSIKNQERREIVIAAAAVLSLLISGLLYVRRSKNVLK